MPFDGFLNDDAIRAKAPSVFATHAAENVSDRYAYLPTYQVIRQMRILGLEVATVREGTKRSPEGRAFAIHEIRMRRPGELPAQERDLGSLVPEAILRNSHDRTSGFSLQVGLFRLLCKNGMTVSDAGFGVQLRHAGQDQLRKMHEGIALIMSQLPKSIEVAAEWNALFPDSNQINRFIDRAVEIRGTALSVEPGQVSRSRRAEDDRPTLWNIFNRVQENLTTGGARGRTATGRRTHLQGVRTLSADVDLNRKLWTAASELATEVKGISVAFA